MVAPAARPRAPRAPRAPQPKPDETLLLHIRAAGLPEPTREYPFARALKRRFRFDGAFVDRMIAYEVDGATWTGGRHTRGAGFERDCEKINLAAILGWRVLRFTSGMVADGRALATLERALTA